MKHLRTVDDVMTDADRATTAERLMARRHLKRLSVVDGDGHLIGVVSLGDLPKVYLRSDADIGTEIRELITGRLTPRGPAEIPVHVPGVVDVKADVTVTVPV